MKDSGVAKRNTPTKGREEMSHDEIEIEFVDAPPATAGRWDATRRKQVQEFAAKLKQSPGRWAIYPWAKATSTAARAAASRISHGRSTVFKGFTAVSRGTTVYICYEADTEREAP